MKIVDIDIVGRDLPVSHVALLQVKTDEGVTGIGATSAPTGVIAALVEDIKPLLIDEDPTHPNRLWRVMFEEWQAQRGRGGEGGIGVNAMAAIDMALWDLTGKALNQPVYRLLGSAIKNRIMVYASATRYDYNGSLKSGKPQMKNTQQLVDESRAYVQEGFKAIKYGWGNHYGPDALDQLTAIREAIGSDVHLMLDFGCPAYNADGWTVKDAANVMRRLEPLNLFFFEEALRPYDVEGFATLTQQSSTKIATGESLVTLRDFEQFIDRRAVDVIQPDAQQIGITTFQRVTARAEAAGMLCIPHCPWTTLAVASHLQVLSTSRAGVMIEYIAMEGFRDVPFQDILQEAMNFGIVETPVVVRDGYLELSDRPGLGLGEFVPEVIEKLETITPIKFP